MSLSYLFPLDEPGLLVPRSPWALDLSADHLNVYGARRGTPTFARASEGLMRTSEGRVLVAVHSQPRTEYFDLDGDGIFETPALCFDGARTNIQPYGADWSQATLTNVTRTTNADSLGQLVFTKLNDADAVNQGVAILPNLTPALTVNGNGAVLVWFAAPDVTSVGGTNLQLHDVTTPASRGGVNVTWSAGAGAGVATITANGGATLLWQRQIGVTAGGRRVYEAAFKPTGTLAASQHAFRCVPAATAAQTGDAYIGWVSVENVTTYPMPMVRNLTASSQAYVAETWALPFDALPQPMTLYVDMIENGTRYEASGVDILSVSNATPTNPRLAIETVGNGAYQVIHHNGTSSVVAAAVAVPNVGQRVQIYATMAANGAVSIEQSIAGGAWSAVVTSGALTPAGSGWSGFSGSTNVYLGHPFANRQSLRLRRARVGLGVVSRADTVGS